MISDKTLKIACKINCKTISICEKIEFYINKIIYIVFNPICILIEYLQEREILDALALLFALFLFNCIIPIIIIYGSLYGRISRNGFTNFDILLYGFLCFAQIIIYYIEIRYVMNEFKIYCMSKSEKW